MVEEVWFEGRITQVGQSTHLLFSIHEITPQEHRAKQMKAEGRVPEDTVSLVHVVRWFQHRLGTAASHHWTLWVETSWLGHPSHQPREQGGSRTPTHQTSWGSTKS